jgi:hypothetical protein
MNKMPAEKLFQTYMDLISKRESEEIYRLNEPRAFRRLLKLFVALFYDFI